MRPWLMMALFRCWWRPREGHGDVRVVKHSVALDGARDRERRVPYLLRRGGARSVEPPDHDN